MIRQQKPKRLNYMQKPSDFANCFSLHTWKWPFLAFWFPPYFWPSSIISFMVWATTRTIWLRPSRTYRNSIDWLLFFCFAMAAIILSFYRIPFNWKTPAGYAVASLVECAGTYSLCLVCLQCHYLYTTSCWGLTYLVKGITNDVPNLTMDSLSVAENRQKFRKLFCAIARRISDVKQLSKTAHTLCNSYNNSNELSFRLVNEFDGLFEFIIMILFWWTLSNICSILLILDIELVEWQRDFEHRFKFVNFCKISIWFYPSWCHSEITRKCRESNGIHEIVCPIVLVVFRYFCVLRFRRNGHHSIRNVQRSTRKMRLVHFS